MKVPASKPELAEAWLYGAVGAAQGVYRHYVKPAVEHEPLAAYALAGMLGGLAVSKLINRGDE